MHDSRHHLVIEEVKAAMRSFEGAERALDADGLLAHLADVPGFHVYNDGRYATYDGVVEAVRSSFPRIRSIEGGFQNVRVIVLEEDAALATASFVEAITDDQGVMTRVRGAATWLWRRVDGAWRIVYGHTDHYRED